MAILPIASRIPPMRMRPPSRLPSWRNAREANVELQKLRRDPKTFDEP